MRQVIEINKKTADKWVRIKHYSRKPSIYWAGYGLLIGGRLEGVCVYGQPSPPIQRHAFKNRDFRLYELSRLVIQTDDKNAASFLIGRSLQMLPKPCAVVSYADSMQNHCGIVYQATNWIYTGATKSHDSLYMVDGERLHSMTVRDRFGVTSPKKWARENGIEIIKPLPKHRYFYLCGDKRQVRQMRSKLSYPSVDIYPKCDQSRYDDGPRL